MKLNSLKANTACALTLITLALPGQVFSADMGNSSAAIVTSKDAVVLSSEKSGKIIKRYLDEGDSFKKGEPLLAFDCVVDKAMLSQARSQLRYAEKNMASSRELKRLNALSELELSQSEAEYAQAKSAVSVKTHEVSACIVKAPYDGQLTQWHVQAFETVQANSELLAIVNNNNLSIEFILSSSMLNTVETGSMLTVYISERDESYPAIIEHIIPLVDSVSQTVKVIARFSDPVEGLWAGMSGKVSVNGEQLVAR